MIIMKRFPLALLSTATLLSLAAATPRVVEAPEFESASFTFRIGRVTLSDTATRIDADIYTRPDRWERFDNNFRLESRITDKVYPVRRIEGVPLRERIFPGDSAHLRATFIFDPLEEADSVFDFIDPDEWFVRGVNLNYRPSGFRTHISGTLTGRPSASWLTLNHWGDDVRVSKSILIPVVNGRFEYDLVTPDTTAYEITPAIDMLYGSWTSYPFLSEGGEVRIDIPDQETHPHEAVKGGPLTQKLMTYYEKRNKVYECPEMEELDRLYRENLFNTPEVYRLDSLISTLPFEAPERDSLFNISTNLRNSPEGISMAGKKARADFDSILRRAKEKEYDFIASDGSLSGLSILAHTFLHGQGEDSDRLLSIYKDVYASRFPGHPYSIAMEQHLSNEKAEVGRHYPDFSAPDLQGNIHRLSDHIRGKYAVIDLWASWCGPCRRHSKELIEVYEKWKDKGFSVVGIARENGDTKAMEQAIEKDGYPWLNLVELNDSGQIWDRYLAGNGSGKILFVSPDGTILLIDPEISEIDSQLPGLLN